jgi:tyrosyl-tRNA synthetase
MKLSEELTYRGHLSQTTFPDLAALDKSHFTLYLGTDPSADSLHIGHLAIYMLVRRFLDHGHTVLLLIGGGTGQIGDPRDTEERSLLSLETIAKNKAALAAQVSALFGGQPFELVDNAAWLTDLNLLAFLRTTGKHFSMTMLLDRDHVKSRIGPGGTGMSFAEFSYTLLQGYDFWHLHREKGVNLQIGGSDQWGNILSGIDLIRKKASTEVHGITAPLVIDKTTGRKFGKSESGATIWLSPEKTSPYDFYQFWLNVGDDSVEDYLKLFTLLDKPTIIDLITRHQSNPAARLAQKSLAYEITKLVHGPDTANSVVKITTVLFGDNNISDLSPKDLSLAATFLPSVPTGRDLISALVASHLAPSKSAARTLISSGAISLNGQKTTTNTTITTPTLIKKGKNKFILAH